MKKSCFKPGIKLIILALIFLLSGCNNADKEDNALESIEKLDNNLKPVNISFYLPGDEKSDAKKVLNEIDKRIKVSLNAKLNIKWIPNSEYYSSIKSSLAAGENFDGFYYFSSDFSSEAKEGKIKVLNDIFPKYAPKLYNTYTKDEIEASKINGNLLCIPKQTPQADLQAVTIREDLRKKYGLPEIKTLDDYELYLKTIKANEKGMVPGGNLYCDSVRLFARANDYIVLDYPKALVFKKRDMKVFPWERTPEFRKLVDYFSRWRKNGYTEVYNDNDFIDYNTLYNKVIKRLIEGKLGSEMSYYGYCDQLNYRLSSPGNIVKRFKDYVLYPDKAFQRSSPCEGTIAFNKNGANVNRAIMFMEWVNSERKNYDLFVYGIVDNHYVLKKGKSKNADNGSYGGWGGQDAFQNYNYFKADEIKYRREDGKNYIKYLDNSKFSPLMGFSLDFTNIQEDSDMRDSEYYSDINKPFLRNKISSSDINTAIGYLKEMGTDNVVAEAQSQINKWKSKK